jgi:hypothetical protein
MPTAKREGFDLAVPGVPSVQARLSRVAPNLAPPSGTKRLHSVQEAGLRPGRVGQAADPSCCRWVAGIARRTPPAHARAVSCAQPGSHPRRVRRTSCATSVRPSGPSSRPQGDSCPRRAGRGDPRCEAWRATGASSARLELLVGQQMLGEPAQRLPVQRDQHACLASEGERGRERPHQPIRFVHAGTARRPANTHAEGSPARQLVLVLGDRVELGDVPAEEVAVDPEQQGRPH